MTPTHTASAERLAEMLVHLARAASAAEGAVPPLTAAQWSALRYFAAAQPSSRTPSAFARFHGASRGTASQTVKALVLAGLLMRRDSDSDRRSVQFTVTDAGRARLAHDPLRRLVDAIAALPEEPFAALHSVAATLVWTVDAARGAATFGLCPDCRYRGCTAEDTPWCARHGRALGAEDLALLCGDFAPRTGAAATDQWTGEAR